MLYSKDAVDTERTHGRLVLSGSAQHRIAAIRRPTSGQLLCAVDHQRPVCHLRRPTESTGQTDDSRSRCRLLRMCLTADRMQFLLTSSRPGTVTPLNPLKPKHFATQEAYNLPFLISDIRALGRSALSARVPERQKLKTVG